MLGAGCLLQLASWRYPGCCVSCRCLWMEKASTEVRGVLCSSTTMLFGSAHRGFIVFKYRSKPIVISRQRHLLVGVRDAMAERIVVLCNAKHPRSMPIILQLQDLLLLSQTTLGETSSMTLSMLLIARHGLKTILLNLLLPRL